jgi:hypothetical protein
VTDVTVMAFCCSELVAYAYFGNGIGILEIRFGHRISVRR